MRCEKCNRIAQQPICSECITTMPVRIRAAVEDAMRVWRAEQAWLGEERRRADRPLYMYEADEERWTVYGSTLRLRDIEFLIEQGASLRASDGAVSTRGLRYLLDDTAELRTKWKNHGISPPPSDSPTAICSEARG